MALYAIFVRFEGITVPGWASTVLPIYIVSGVQLFSLGVIGEYVGKIYIETKGRPRFLIADQIEARQTDPSASVSTETSERPQTIAALVSDRP